MVQRVVTQSQALGTDRCLIRQIQYAGYAAHVRTFFGIAQALCPATRRGFATASQLDVFFTSWIR